MDIMFKLVEDVETKALHIIIELAFIQCDEIIASRYDNQNFMNLNIILFGILQSMYIILNQSFSLKNENVDIFLRNLQLYLDCLKKTSKDKDRPITLDKLNKQMPMCFVALYSKMEDLKYAKFKFVGVGTSSKGGHEYAFEPEP